MMTTQARRDGLIEAKASTLSAYIALEVMVINSRSIIERERLLPKLYEAHYDYFVACQETYADFLEDVEKEPLLDRLLNWGRGVAEKTRTIMTPTSLLKGLRHASQRLDQSKD
jgi:hypothetical protein